MNYTNLLGVVRLDSFASYSLCISTMETTCGDRGPSIGSMDIFLPKGLMYQLITKNWYTCNAAYIQIVYKYQEHTNTPCLS